MSRARPSPRRHRWRLRLTRDVVLFTTGLVLLIFEITLRETPDPGALVACTTILLAPGVLRYEEWGRRRDRDDQ